MTSRRFNIWILCMLASILARAQSDSAELNRIREIESLLQLHADSNIPELNAKIDFSVSEASVREFLRGLAESAELNININPAIEGIITNNFKKETALNIIVFLCREYDLEFEVIGTILSFSQIKEDLVIPKKEYNIQYAAYNDLLSIDVRNDTLFNVLKDISQKSRKNVSAVPEIQDLLITAFISSLPFEEAIQSLAYANNLIINKKDRSVFFLQPGVNFVAGIPDQTLVHGAANDHPYVGRNNFGSGIEVQPSENELLVSANISRYPIMDLLNELSGKSGLDYVFINEPPETVSLQISDMPHDDFLALILNATQFTFRKKNDVYIIGGRNEEGLRSSELIQLKYRSTSEIAELIPANVAEGVEIREFKELNGLLVSGSSPQIEEIKDFVTNLDRLIPVVQIEVIVIDVQKGRDIQTGITAGVSDSISTGGTILPGIDFTLSSNSINSALEALDKRNIVNLGKVNPNFYTTLQALEQNNNIRIRSTPKLATLNGHEASLTIGRTEYYLEQTQNIQGANNLVTTITPQFREISADLNIVINPVVSADEQVTLDIDAEFSDFTPSFVPNGPPGKASRKFNSLIRIRNNDMIVLGGLEEENKSKSGSGIPLLARIPVLNRLFSSQADSKSESKLLVFIRPTILY